MDVATEYWNSLQSYKSYLPAADARQAQSYVVLACRIQRPEALHILRESGPLGHASRLQTDDNGQYDYQSDSYTSRAHSRSALPTIEEEDNRSFCSNVSHSNSVTSACRSNHINYIKSDADIPASQLHADSLGASKSRCACTRSGAKGDDDYDVAYFMFRKKDVRPPSVKYTLAQKKMRHCLFACERVACKCEAPHVKRDAWRLNLSSLTQLPILVSSNGQNRRLTLAEIVPTAGYFFSLGLKHLGVVQAVIPIICKFNQKCRYGASCLYMHSSSNSGGEKNTPHDTGVHDTPPAASPQPRVRQAHLALRTLYMNAPMDIAKEEKTQFFDFLEEEGMETVGDVQVMGVAAFELLARRVPSRWAEAFLAVTVLRNLDLSTPLENVLLMFPKVNATATTLPASLRTVGSLLTMPTKLFHGLNISPRVMDACEIIRNRYELDTECCVISLNRQPSCSFVTRVMRLITSFHPAYTHSSWRKHDPTRPVVTCVLTFVNVHTCRCSACSITGLDESPRNSSSYLVKADIAHAYPSNRCFSLCLEDDGKTVKETLDRCSTHDHADPNGAKPSCSHALVERVSCDASDASTHSTDVSDASGAHHSCPIIKHGEERHEDTRAVAEDDTCVFQPSSSLFLGVPEGSWCTCARQGVIAVNYELSTPSGSRCSEQNAMGKLASMGVPTWSVREVFVHGVHHTKEVNPLFPCGVCENMLRKVNHDVNDRYGCDVVLHMFDSQAPRRVVCLPIPAISHRDGINFKRIVKRDGHT